MGRIGLNLGVSLTCLIALVTVPPGASVAEVRAHDEGLVVVHLKVSCQKEIDFLVSWLDVWHADLDKGILDAAVDDDQMQMLRELGFELEIDRELTESYTRPLERLKGQTDGIPGYPCYRTVEETLTTGADLAATYPGLAEWIDIGDSWEKTAPGDNAGYDLMVLQLTNTRSGIPGSDRPKLWVMGAIHARELATAETVTRFAEHLLASYDVDPDVTWLLDHHELHLLLNVNPDGRKHAEAGLYWRKNTNASYCVVDPSNRGADLNRNFDFNWGCCEGSSPGPCRQTYRGAAPASEPETQAVRDWLTNNFTDWRPDDLTTPAPDTATGIFIDVHSYGSEVWSAFNFQDPPSPNDGQIYRLARKLSFFTGYEAMLGGAYVMDGASTDFGYGRFGMPAFTFEIGNRFFQDCASFESRIFPKNLQALLYAARAVRAPYTQPSGPEVLYPAAQPMVVDSGEIVTLTAVIDDTRYGYGTSSPPASVEEITDAELYIDVPPWQDGAEAIAMTAVDGAFDSSSESVTVSFSSSGLAEGRHLLYLRGRDAARYWGTVRAVFVWVLDSSVASHISVRLSDAETHLPLEGKVSAGIFSTATEPDSGTGILRLPAGTYELTATAEGYRSRTMPNAVAITGATTSLNVALSRYHVILDDDAEEGNLGWASDGQWTISSEASASPSHSWTDSPQGDYGNDWDSTLTSPVLDLHDVANVVLEFSHTYELEGGWDFGHVEWSADDGHSWTTAMTYDGMSPDWEQTKIEIPGLDQATSARIRFRIETDGSITFDGWHIDDVLIAGLKVQQTRRGRRATEATD
jgi:hypothetical protein